MLFMNITDIQNGLKKLQSLFFIKIKTAIMPKTPLTPQQVKS